MMRLQWVASPEFNNYRENWLSSRTPKGETPILQLMQAHGIQWKTPPPPPVEEVALTGEEVDLTGENNVEVDDSEAEQDVEEMYTTAAEV
jgi:hypothetical protein